jgi:hypothetical protein
MPGNANGSPRRRWHTVLVLCTLVSGVAVLACCLVLAILMELRGSGPGPILGTVALTAAGLAVAGVFWFAWGWTFVEAANPIAAGARPPRTRLGMLTRYALLPAGIVGFWLAIMLVLFSRRGGQWVVNMPVVVGTAAFVTLAAIGWGWRHILKRRVRRSAIESKVCYQCGYDLRASPSSECPECGHVNATA